jgi:hypothetical protein
MNLYSLSGDEYLTGAQAPGTKYCQGKLGPTRSRESGKPDDFTSSDVERDVPQQRLRCGGRIA